MVKQELDTYDTYQQRIAECDEQLQQQLASFASAASAVAAAPVTEPQGDEQPKKVKVKPKKLTKNAPRFNLEQELQRVAGVDLTRIDEIDVMVAQTILAEVGLDMGRWKTEDNFVSWLGLCPDNRITSNKVIGRGTRHVVNRAATSLRMAANALLRSQTYLGALYRRLRTKLGAPKAITAMAHRLARLVYRMLKYGQRYVDKGAENYEQRYRNQQLHFLRKKAAQLGFQLTEAQAPTV